MNFLRAPFLLTATFPLAASVVVLAIADVGKSVWLMHLLLICAAGLLAAAGQFLNHRTRRFTPAYVMALLTLIGIAAPLFIKSSGPHRWVRLGPLSLYMAPLLLPSFYAACSAFLRKRGKLEPIAFAALIGASLLLAMQPDASQVLALLAGSAILLLRYRSDLFWPAVTLAIIALAAAWAFARPDPLEPVPHVEGVFALALTASLLAGLAVIASAFIFVAGLFACSRRGPAWLSAVAVYYAVLFLCSVAGLTPAPLIGYGAGPLLGFGLLAAVSGGLILKRCLAVQSSRRRFAVQLDSDECLKEITMAVKSCIPVIPSANLEKSLRLWVDGLGFEMDTEMRAEGRLIFCMLHKGDLRFMLNQRAGTPVKPDGYEGIRLYWNPINIHETRERLIQLGFVVSDICKRDYGQTEFFLTDDDGYSHCFGVAAKR